MLGYQYWAGKAARDGILIQLLSRGRDQFAPAQVRERELGWTWNRHEVETEDLVRLGTFDVQSESSELIRIPLLQQSDLLFRRGCLHFLEVEAARHFSKSQRLVRALSFCGIVLFEELLVRCAVTAIENLKPRGELPSGGRLRYRPCPKARRGETQLQQKEPAFDPHRR